MITVTGSLAFDTIMDFDGKFGDHIMPDKIHQINLSFLVNTLKKQKGGTLSFAETFRPGRQRLIFIFNDSLSIQELIGCKRASGKGLYVCLYN